MKFVIIWLVFAAETLFAFPVTNPVYQNSQYVSAQAIPAAQYKQQQQPQSYLQPQYISVQTARPVYEADKGAGLQKYSTQIKQPIQQVLLSTNVDRQVQQKAVQYAGPLYLQQVQQAQQQNQAQQAIDTAQRKLTSQTFAKQIQPVPVIQPQPQYLRQLPQQQPQPARYVQQQPQPARYVASQQQPQPVRYVAPNVGYRRPPPQQEQQAEEQENPEDYDPNPSYQFGFDVNDDLYTNYQNRKEQREGNKITGSYSVVDSDGFVRTVTYTADPKEGFKAEVTRQPTDIVVKIPKPDPQFIQRQQQPQQQYQQQVAQQRAPAQRQPQYQYE